MVHRKFACRRPINASLCLALISLTGCQAIDSPHTNQKTNSTAAPQGQVGSTSDFLENQIQISSSDFDQSLELLRSLGFELDRIDHRQGLITTLPKVVRPSFEWAGFDSLPSPDVAHTFGLTRVVHIQTHSQTRTQTHAPSSHTNLTTESDTKSPKVQPVTIAVYLMRPQRPLIQPSMTAGRGRMRSLSSVPTELEQQGVPAAYSELIGRDVLAEAYLLEKLSQSE